MDIHNFLLFAFASLMLNLTPGADMLYVATRSTGQGIKAGIVSAFGIMGGCMVHIFAAVVGLSAIVASSATAFSIVKWLGAAYLAYLGLKSIFSRKNHFSPDPTAPPMRYSRIFWQGVITNVLNPKVALFFLAFLPQFINPAGGKVYEQVLLLGSWFNVSGTIVNILVALLFGRIGGWLSRSAWFEKWQTRITGAILLGLGLKLAFSSRK
jgi:threonine/homoserine/homoserine lactone efflux protein